MNDRYDAPEMNVAVDPEPDPRIVAMHRVVDLEQQYERAARESEQRQKMAAIAKDELREARDQLSGLLGYPSNSGGVKAMDSATLGATWKEDDETPTAEGVPISPPRAPHTPPRPANYRPYA